MCGICTVYGLLCNDCPQAVMHGLRACERCESLLVTAEALAAPPPMVQTICPALLHSPSLVPNSLPGTVVPANNEAAVVYLPVATAGIPTAITVIPANVVDIPAAVVDAPTVTHTFGGNNTKEGKEDKKQRKRDPDVVIHQAPETLIPKKLQRNTIRRCEGHKGKTVNHALVDACRTCRIRCASSTLRSELRRIREGRPRPVSKASPLSPRKKTNAKTVALHRRKENDLRALLDDGERGKLELIYHVGAERVIELEKLLEEVPLPAGNWYST